MTSFAVAGALEHDHRTIDAQFERVKSGLVQGEWHRESFQKATEALRHHIYVEEEALFPLLRQAGMVAPVFVMIREHGEIWRALEAIEGEDGRTPSGRLQRSPAWNPCSRPTTSKRSRSSTPQAIRR